MGQKSIFSFGILGDGQLARMLIQAAQSMGTHPLLYSQSKKAPASLVCKNIEKDLKTFLAKTKIVCFESEFIDVEKLSKLKMKQNKFVPSLKTMQILQNKLEQKKLLTALKIPTAPFEKFNSKKASLNEWLKHCLKNNRTTLKWARMGYDGKGVFFLKKQNQKQALEFCKKAQSQKIDLYAEEKINFIKETAIIACYSLSKKFKTYSLVITEQENGICKKVFGPITSFGISKSLSKQLQTSAEKTAFKLAKKLNLHGTFAIEFFLTKTSKLLVNEIAPRVHNSGHYTMNAATTSQFENHIRAILDLPLGKTTTNKKFIMLNLLGPRSGKLSNSIWATLKKVPKEISYQLHWYEKKIPSPGRKLGHINFTSTPTTSTQKLLVVAEQKSNTWDKQ